MITTNINTTPPNYEEEINSFYLTQLDRTYDEGVVLSNSSSIGCRPLAFAIKAGTKILINGISLEIYSDAAQSAVEFFITATTLTESINKGAKITIDKENLFLQYQRKTEGQVAGFDIDADGISKGGIEITGWLNSDTLEGATINNLPTALSVKNYVDNSHPAEDQTLQEVTDRGNTTTNSATFGAYVFAERFRTTVAGAANFAAIYMNSDSNSGFFQPSSDTIGFTTAGAEKMRITSAGNLLLGTTTDSGAKLTVYGTIKFTGGYVLDSAHSLRLDSAANQPVIISANDSEKMRITSAGNVGIGTSSPSVKLDIAGTDSNYIAKFTHSTSSGYAPGSILLEAGQSLSRGQGVYHYNNVANENWFTGVPYAVNSKKWIVANLYSTAQDVTTAQLQYALLTIDSDSGNVGIGTTAPDEKLQVNGVLNIVVNETAYAAGYFAKIKSQYGPNPLIIESKYGNLIKAEDYGKALSFHTGNTATAERLRILSNGNVGIGTTAPTEKLHVVGDALITGGLEVNAANIDFRGLGTSDPGVVGRLWQDSGILKISEG